MCVAKRWQQRAANSLLRYWQKIAPGLGSTTRHFREKTNWVAAGGGSEVDITFQRKTNRKEGKALEQKVSEFASKLLHSSNR